MSELEFNYHETTDEFLRWFMIFCVSDAVNDKVFDKIREATNNFTDVKMTVSVNGHSLDITRFIERMHRDLDHQVEREAVKLVKAIDIPDLCDIIQKTRIHLLQQLEKAGVPINEDDWTSY